MVYKSILLASVACLAVASPVAPSKRADSGEGNPPKSYYIEKDLDPGRPTVPEATVTKIRYGPYPIKANSMNDYILRWSLNIKKPCEDCYITAMQAGLEDKAGKSVNIDSGAWLHHIVIMNGLGFTPGSKQDPVCTGTIYSLGLGYPNRIFASGNERAVIRINAKHKFGMPVDKGDMFHSSIELVNQSDKDAEYWITMLYEWVPKTESGYKPAKMLWMDVTGCGYSHVDAKEGDFEFKSPGWKSTIEGALLYTIGHTHDGGIYTTVYINGKPVCRSEQLYGTKPEFFEKAGTSSAEGHAHGSKAVSRVSGGGPDNLHISEVSSCVDFGILKKGDIVTVGAWYNSSAHSLNAAHPGHAAGEKFAPVMGIHPVYVGEGLMTL